MQLIFICNVANINFMNSSSTVSSKYDVLPQTAIVQLVTSEYEMKTSQKIIQSKQVLKELFYNAILRKTQIDIQSLIPH